LTAGAEQQVAISDGGSGLEDFFRTHFPKAECILDFWHAKEHLVELGQALYPSDDAQRRQWTDQACHRLKHKGGRAVREWLEGLELSEASAELKEEHRRQVQYFRNRNTSADWRNASPGETGSAEAMLAAGRRGFGFTVTL